MDSLCYCWKINSIYIWLYKYSMYFTWKDTIQVIGTLQKMLNTHRSRIITIFALYIHTECKLNLHEAQINLVKSLLEFLNFHANLCMCHSLTIINHSDLNPAIVNYKVLNNTILPHKNVVRQTDFAPFGSFIIGVIFRLII